MSKIIFWSMASHGAGISGGDRIFIEFARRWSKSSQITVVTWAEGEAMMQRNNLVQTNRIKFERLHVPMSMQKNFFICYLFRIIISIIKSFSWKLANPENIFLYSSSEFWMDALPCAILKLRFPKIRWVATWYQTAPSPLTGFSNGLRSNAYRGSALLLWAVQLLVKPVIKGLADVILVNNDLEKLVFPTKNTLVVLGAVDTPAIDNYRKGHKDVKKYAAVFQGRFHPQKGVVELVDIWDQVVQKQKNARLAMIGDGPLMSEVRAKIHKLHLDKNVDLFGFVLDGKQKYKIFAQSHLVVHPAFFDSGGMAAAEAMAFGIPAVGFNLPAYDSYYPVGMVKVPVGDTRAFAQAILNLLNDSSERNALGKQAEEFIHHSYSWEHRAEQILRQITETTTGEMGKG